MAKSNRQERNTFQKGDVGKHYRYLDSLPKVSKESSNDNIEHEEDVAAVKEKAPDSNVHNPDGVGRLDDNEYDGDNIDEGSYASVDIEKGENLEADQISKPEIYSLRNRKVYSMMLVSHTQNKYSKHVKLHEITFPY